MAFDSSLMEKILSDDIFSPDFLLPKSDSAELLLFKDVEEWYAVASLLRDGQVSIIRCFQRQRQGKLEQKGILQKLVTISIWDFENPGGLQFSKVSESLTPLSLALKKVE